jgi:hypothetical protein
MGKFFWPYLKKKKNKKNKNWALSQKKKKGPY